MYEERAPFHEAAMREVSVKECANFGGATRSTDVESERHQVEPVRMRFKKGSRLELTTRNKCDKVTVGVLDAGGTRKSQRFPRDVGNQRRSH